MEQIATPMLDNQITNSLVKPLIRKNVKILSPGVWTGTDGRATIYTSEQIENGFLNSDWENMNLYLDHKDSKGPAVAYWIGFVRNARMEVGALVGDLEIWHPLISMFIDQAKAKFAVSATMNGNETISLSGNPSEYRIDNFQSVSIVDEPGDSGAWIPKMLSKGVEGNKTVTSGIEDKKELAKESKGMTSMVSDHSHTWDSENKVTSTNNDHKHKIDLKSMMALESNDHTHKLLGATKENAVHENKKKLDESKKEMSSSEDKEIESKDKKELSTINTSKKKSDMSETTQTAKELGIKESKESSKQELDSYKEVKKMTENQTNESIEEQKEEVTKTKEEVKSESEEEVTKTKEEVKSESEEEVTETKETVEAPAETESEDVKELSAKVDSLADSVGKLATLVQKSLSASENSEKETKEESETEESSTEETKEEAPAEAEESEVEKELEETKKELAAARAELDSPDAKTLSKGGVDAVSNDDANIGMINFLRAQGNIQ